MRCSWIRTLACALLLSGCAADRITEPEAAPPPTLSGRWVGSTPVASSTPSGGVYTLTLDLTLLQVAGAVSGSGVMLAEGMLSFAMTVKQGINSYPNFSLVLGASGYEDVVYTGSFNSAHEILGRLNGSGFLDHWIALRKQ